MTINQDRLGTLAAEARSAFKTLETLSTVEKTAYMNDPAIVDRVRYKFIIAIQACIDICTHIVARKGRRAATSYGDCFAVLEEMEILRPDVCKGMKRLAGLRNRLVRLYWEIDDERVFEVLKTDLGIIREYLTTVTRVNFDE